MRRRALALLKPYTLLAREFVTDERQTVPSGPEGPS